MRQVAAWLDRVLVAKGDATVASTVRGEIRTFCERFPLFGHASA
jgi:glycine/serine hydroxymethyltransferase